MSARQDRPSVRSRALLAVGIAGMAVVAIAARMPASQQPAQPPAMPPMPPATVTPGDSMAPKPDSMIMIDTATVTMAAPAPVEAPAAPTAWPVDPVTGQTLINGVPVVGRVFIMRKPDGLVKIKDVATVLAPEAMPPMAPVVAPNRAPLAPTAVRRQRNAMVQATLWGSDDKPSVVRNRHYRQTTSGASLGQR